MSIFSKFLKNAGHAVSKAGHDTLGEVKRHPVIYGTAAGLLLPGVGATLGGLAGKAVGALGGGGAGSVLSAAGGVPGDIEGAGADVFGGGGAPSGGQSRFRSILGALSKHKNDILDYGAAAEGLYNQHRKNSMQDEALNLAHQQYDANAPLRAEGQSLMLDQSAPDMSGILDGPQRRYRPVNVGSVAR